MKDWQEFFQNEELKTYYTELMEKTDKFYRTSTVYPKREDLFRAFKLTPLNQVKVVILGQDPYFNENQAHGLSFSVQKGVKIPPSLQNIFKEIERDFGYPLPSHGDLSSWAYQGVLLLNNTLTVEAGKPLSHSKIGWEEFTNEVMRLLNEQEQPIVYILWGNDARKKKRWINNPGHLVLESAHPSPLSAYRGFFGNGHFSKANKFLIEKNTAPIDWSIRA